MVLTVPKSKMETVVKDAPEFALRTGKRYEVYLQEWEYYSHQTAERIRRLKETLGLRTTRVKIRVVRGKEVLDLI